MYLRNSYFRSKTCRSFKENEKTFIIKNKSPISFEFKSNCVHLSPALSILIEVH